MIPAKTYWTQTRITRLQYRTLGRVHFFVSVFSIHQFRGEDEWGSALPSTCRMSPYTRNVQSSGTTITALLCTWLGT